MPPTHPEMNLPDHDPADVGPVQGVFDFEFGSMNGYANWRQQQERWLAAVRAEWRLPVGRHVRIKLKTMDHELVGKLKAVDLPVTIDKRIPLRLNVDGVDVWPADIERCVVIE